MSDPPEEQRPVQAVLDGLADGSVTVEEAAADFAGRTWPKRAPAPLVGGVPNEESDPEPEPPESWALVEGAYVAGKIDEATYTQLAEAAAKSSPKTATAEGSEQLP